MCIHSLPTTFAFLIILGSFRVCRTCPSGFTESIAGGLHRRKGVVCLRNRAAPPTNALLSSRVSAHYQSCNEPVCLLYVWATILSHVRIEDSFHILFSSRFHKHHPNEIYLLNNRNVNTTSRHKFWNKNALKQLNLYSQKKTTEFNYLE